MSDEYDLEYYRKELNPKITQEQVDIINFWRIRGFEIITHILGMSISLQQKGYNTGLSLQYLEQFREQAISSERERTAKGIFDKIKKVMEDDYDGSWLQNIEIDFYKEVKE